MPKLLSVYPDVSSSACASTRFYHWLSVKIFKHMHTRRYHHRFFFFLSRSILLLLLRFSWIPVGRGHIHIGTTFVMVAHASLCVGILHPFSSLFEPLFFGIYKPTSLAAVHYSIQMYTAPVDRQRTMHGIIKILGVSCCTTTILIDERCHTVDFRFTGINASQLIFDREKNTIDMHL